MERRQQSSSSFSSGLFGAKDSSSADSSASGIVGSIFAPLDKASGKESLQLSETEKKKKNCSASQAQSSETGIYDNNLRRGQEQNDSIKSQNFRSYHQEANVQPFHYSSSIYYGGQDVYSQPQNAQNPGLTFSKETVEDDKGLASRGNWWQGSLYY